MNKVLDLYLCFLKIGAVNFGGGYAMLPLLQRELTVNRKWIEEEELTDYYAVGQCTPGPIAMNVSTFIGHKIAGMPGALAATMGFITVPFFIILIISAFLRNFADIPVIQHAFAGIRVCVCVLIFQAILKLWKGAIKDTKSIILYIVILFLTLFSKQLPISIPAAVLVITAGVFGIIIYRNEPAPKVKSDVKVQAERKAEDQIEDQKEADK